MVIVTQGSAPGLDKVSAGAGTELLRDLADKLRGEDNPKARDRCRGLEGPRKDTLQPVWHWRDCRAQFAIVTK
jgi:hypothetical protein